jgi:hypothetical protein
MLARGQPGGADTEPGQQDHADGQQRPPRIGSSFYLPVFVTIYPASMDVMVEPTIIGVSSGPLTVGDAPAPSTATSDLSCRQRGLPLPRCGPACPQQPPSRAATLPGRYRPGNWRQAEDADPRARSTMNGPSEDRFPAPDSFAASTVPISKRRHRRYPNPFSRRYDVAGSDTKTPMIEDDDLASGPPTLGGVTGESGSWAVREGSYSGRFCWLLCRGSSGSS